MTYRIKQLRNGTWIVVCHRNGRDYRVLAGTEFGQATAQANADRLNAQTGGAR